MTEKEKMLSGKLYNPYDIEIENDVLKARKITRLYNGTKENQVKYRTKLLKKLFYKTGEIILIEPPFRCEYGSHISVGENFYANFDCIILDEGKVIIGNNVFLGPRVCIYAVGHPIDAGVRSLSLEYTKTVTIGDDVWVGGNSVIMPGITIGNNTVIGSGSIVTKNIPGNVIAMGNPCTVFRAITDEDKMYWEKMKNEF